MVAVRKEALRLIGDGTFRQILEKRDVPDNVISYIIMCVEKRGR